jgi:hypothetical protein
MVEGGAKDAHLGETCAKCATMRDNTWFQTSCQRVAPSLTMRTATGKNDR